MYTAKVIFCPLLSIKSNLNVFRDTVFLDLFVTVFRFGE